MSLRTRLALVLAAIMIGPLLAAWAAVGVLVPQAAAASSVAALDRAAAAGSAYLGQQCLGLGDAARAAALQLAAGQSNVAASPDADPALRAVSDLVARRPGASAFVVRNGVVAAGAGPLATRLAAPDVVAAAQTSCARRQAPGPPASPAVAGLVESVPVTQSSGVEIARVVVIRPLDSAAVREVAQTLRLDVGLVLVTPSGQLVASSVPPGDLATLLALPGLLPGSGGVSAGESGPWRYRVDREPAGVPYAVIAVSPVDGSRLQLVLLAAVLVFLAVFGGLLVVLAGRLTGPLAALTRTAQRLGGGDLGARSGIDGRDEVGTLAGALDSMATTLQSTIMELQAGRDALAETFEQFGAALAHTHDLDGLLRTVVEAAKQGSGAIVGTALIGEGGPLEERVSSAPDGADGLWVTGVLDRLAALAARAVVTGAPVTTDLEPVAGTAVAVPLRRGEEVVGALAVTRGSGAAALDAAAIGAVAALASHAGTAIANVVEHQTAQRLSVTDPLTGAGNFRQLSSTLSREVERASRFARPLSVLMLDLDHFKQVNDNHGHAFGDAVLREFAHRLQACLREVDLVARYGGEEFAVVLPETPPEGAMAVAARVVEAVRGEIFASGGQSREVTVSVGIAAYPDHGRSAGEVLRSADAALYAAKHSGRDRWMVAGTPGVPVGVNSTYHSQQSH